MWKFTSSNQTQHCEYLSLVVGQSFGSEVMKLGICIHQRQKEIWLSGRVSSVAATVKS